MQHLGQIPFIGGKKHMNLAPQKLMLRHWFPIQVFRGHFKD